jgi:hypothetical protein
VRCNKGSVQLTSRNRSSFGSALYSTALRQAKADANCMTCNRVDDQVYTEAVRKRSPNSSRFTIFFGNRSMTAGIGKQACSFAQYDDESETDFWNGGRRKESMMSFGRWDAKQGGQSLTPCAISPVCLTSIARPLHPRSHFVGR